MRKIAPLDELDDPQEWRPPLLPRIRFCGAPGCRRRARPGGRHCSGCHAVAVRRYREDHRRELAVRRQDAAGGRDEDARARDSARAKLAMALRRGTLKRGRCRACGAGEVVGLIADPARWREVVWVCRAHRETELERRQDAAAQQAADAKQAAWYDERDRVLAAIELLPSAERAQLHVLAARGPAGTQLSPGAPLYIMNLVRVYTAQFAHTVFRINEIRNAVCLTLKLRATGLHDIGESLERASLRSAVPSFKAPDRGGAHAGALR